MRTLDISTAEYEALWQVYHRSYDVLLAPRGRRRAAERALGRALEKLEDTTRSAKLA